MRIEHHAHRFCPQGVGALLARDLARSGSKPSDFVYSDVPRLQDLLPETGCNR